MSSPDAAGDTSALSARQQRTRQRLIDAARTLLASGEATDLSILKLTRLAGVGNGSFYNFFRSKTELFDAALEEVLEEHGRMVDTVTAGMSGAEAFATGLRLTTRLNWTHPQVAEIFIRSGSRILEFERGITPRALADLQKAIEDGEIDLPSPILAYATVINGLIGMLHVHALSPGLVDERTCDDLAARFMRMIGMDAERAAEIVRRPLP